MQHEQQAISPPGKQIQARLELLGWNQTDLAEVLEVPNSVVSALISGRRSISIELDRTLSAAFGDQIGYWLKLETEFSLFAAESEGTTNTDDVARRAEIYKRGPIREMQRRGWIKQGGTIESLEAEIKAFFGPPLTVSTRRSAKDVDLTPAQDAWCHRAHQMATALQVGPFKEGALDSAEAELRKLAAYVSEAKRVSKVLGSYGIRFVIVEPVAGAKIDGAAFWLNDKAPVIALSARFDRIDAFWFTLMHEFSHIKNGDSLSVDSEIVNETGALSHTEDSHEARANTEAAGSLIPFEEIDSFVRRMGPLYSKDRIIQFAHRVKIHPGIIVGQLQHRGELAYSMHRDLLVKCRSNVIDTALTDGWGKTITPGVL
jgi:HTH-type transcriptional regulator / antitoxin HigA